LFSTYVVLSFPFLFCHCIVLYVFS
jgi:hypothetical protein